MKKAEFAAITALAVLAFPGRVFMAPAAAAYQQPVEQAAAFNWSGFYAGTMLGGSGGNAKTHIKKDNFKLGKERKIKPDSFIGGVFWGYNRHLSRNIIGGFTSDFTWNSGDDDKKYNFGGGRLGKITAKQQWNSASRLRLGYAAGREGRFLPYLVGGVSFTNIQLKNTLYHKDYSRANRDWKRSKTKNYIGWNIGAGIDYAPDWAFLGVANGHMLLRAEYRYTDFGKKNYKMYNGYKDRMKYSQNDFRVGAAYKF